MADTHTAETIDVGAPHHLIPAPTGRAFSLVPTSLGEAMELARMIAASDFAPKDYVNKPGNVVIAIQMGLDVGLKPMQALQNIAVINGRPSIWGDAAIALAQNAGVLERFHETFTGGEMLNPDGTANMAFTAVCTIKRKGWADEIVRTFSVADAIKAGLWSKAGPWQTYPKRMLQMRARSFALRDGAADVLMGLSIIEEALDLPQGTQTTLPVGQGAGELTVAPGVTKLKELPEALQENVEKAFEALSMPPGLRMAKLNEFLLAGPAKEGDADVTLEEKANRLLEWCRDEYAKRKTGMPRAAKGGDANGKGKPAETAAAGGVPPAAGTNSPGTQAAAVPPATASTPQTQVAPPPVVAPVAPDQKLGF